MPPKRNVPWIASLLPLPLAIACAKAGTSTPLEGGVATGSSSGGSGGTSSSGVGTSSDGGGSSGVAGSGGSSGGSGIGNGSSSDADAGGVQADAGDTDGGCANRAPAVFDDFESGSLGAWRLTDPYGNPIAQGSSQYQITVDTSRAHSGTRSVKVHGGGLLGVAPPAPAFYGRVWAWLGSSPGDVPTGGHWGWIIGVGAGDAGQPIEVRMGGQFGILIHNYSLNDDVVLSDPNFFNDGMAGGARPIAGVWTCVEFYFGKDSLRTWINGSEIAGLDVNPITTWAHGMKAPWSPAYGFIRIGYANYNANAVDVWYDDVALDAARICCPPYP